MIVNSTEIPDAVVAALTAYVSQGGKTAGAVEGEATRLLLARGITDTKRYLPHRVADRVLQKLRRAGQIEPIRDGRLVRWNVVAPTVH